MELAAFDADSIKRMDGPWGLANVAILRRIQQTNLARSINERQRNRFYIYEAAQRRFGSIFVQTS